MGSNPTFGTIITIYVTEAEVVDALGCGLSRVEGSSPSCHPILNISRSGGKVDAPVLETSVFMTCGFESHLRY